MITAKKEEKDSGVQKEKTGGKTRCRTHETSMTKKNGFGSWKGKSKQLRCVVFVYFKVKTKKKEFLFCLVGLI